MDERQAPDNYWLLPVGGTREGGSHKGYGLSCCGRHPGRCPDRVRLRCRPRRPNFGDYVAAYSVDAFTEVSHFKQEMDEWVRMMNATKPAPGHERVIVAGQPEADMEALRRDEGIPLHPRSPSPSATSAPNSASPAPSEVLGEFYRLRGKWLQWKTPAQCGSKALR